MLLIVQTLRSMSMGQWPCAVHTCWLHFFEYNPQDMRHAAAEGSFWPPPHRCFGPRNRVVGVHSVHMDRFGIAAAPRRGQWLLCHCPDYLDPDLHTQSTVSGRRTGSPLTGYFRSHQQMEPDVGVRDTGWTGLTGDSLDGFPSRSQGLQDKPRNRTRRRMKRQVAMVLIRL